MPAAVGGLIVATVVTSLASAVGGRNGLPLHQFLLFDTGAVWRGEVWRLVTWVLVETDPLNLLFGGLVLYWFGRDLCDAWGERRFLVSYFAFPAVAAVLTSLLALVVPVLDAYRLPGFWVALERPRRVLGRAPPVPADPALLRGAGLGQGARLGDRGGHGALRRSSTASPDSSRTCSPRGWPGCT